MTRIWQHKAKALKFYCGFNLVTLVFVSGCPITCHPSISKWSVAAFSLGMWITVNKETSVLSVGCSSSGGPQPWSVEETWAKGCWCHGLDTEVSIFIFPGGLIQILSSIFMFILLIFIFILLYIYGSINCIHIYMHKVAFHALSFLHALLYSVRELESCSLEVQLNKDLCIMLSAFACVKHNRKIMPASSIYRQM